MNASDKEAIHKLTERLQNAQAELRIIADRAGKTSLDMAHNKLLLVIQWMQESEHE